jgi:hypothetical protein
MKSAVQLKECTDHMEYISLICNTATSLVLQLDTLYVIVFISQEHHSS